MSARKESLVLVFCDWRLWGSRQNLLSRDARIEFRCLILTGLDEFSLCILKHVLVRRFEQPVLFKRVVD